MTDAVEAGKRLPARNVSGGRIISDITLLMVFMDIRGISGK